ncbi:Deuterolysin M35 metalloprotease [Ceratobasidium theobromae]|uniref:Deuterolysin M35 metalloprotease n=1 Tax=Ceratobasidium theobromae TaxID=1582974 RepID=A0A5N5Q8K2_9AGAM|nr:Deuterolysin M35 metalloprotease [Ceratobasidium theobromae]
MKTIFAASLASALALSVSAVPSISLAIGTSKQVNGVDNLTVTTIVHNTGNETLKLLNHPNSLLSTSETDKFEISSENGSPEFIGTMVKYVPDYAIRQNYNNNDPASFTVLEPGQMHEITHNLAGMYNFTSTGARDYKLSAHNIFYHVDESGNLATIEATTGSEPTTFGIAGELVSKTAIERRQSHIVKRASPGPNFSQCAAAQKSDIQLAVVGAQSLTSAAIVYLNNVKAATPRYTTWFGAYDKTRRDTVLNHLNAISGKFKTSTYDCKPPSNGHCGLGVFAYVFPSQPGTVYLCSDFWKSPQTGTDSKAGTVVHEHTHFTIYGGTSDFKNGQTKCKQLAISTPNQAVMNADSHEYFVENTPALQ